MARLNKTEAGLLWLCGLVAFAAMLAIVLSLCLTANKQSSGCKNEPACRNGDTSCCQPVQPPCTDTGSGQAGDCDAGNESQSPQVVKLQHELTVRPDPSPWTGQLTLNRPGPGLGDLVTESRLRAFIPGKIICEGRRFETSGLIYFDRGQYTLDGKEIKKIHGFLHGAEQIKKLWVFSFTSPDGENSHNDQLALKRACAVHDEIAETFQGSINLTPIGEDHPINGIANSRSVVIAACWATPGEAGTADKRDTTPPSCIDTSRSD